jgi:uncharacterized protein DUF222
VARIERMSEAQQQLPEDLENIAPGPELATLLASLDRTALSGKDRVRLLQARHRLAAHMQGEMYADMYAISRDEPTDEPDGSPHDEPPEPYPWASTEISFALRWTYTAASVRLEQARRMIEDLPAVASALRAGEIDVPKALLLCDEVSALELPIARRIIDRLIDKAADLTTGQLRAKLRRLVIAADPAAAANRAKVGVTGRRVVIAQDHDNLASISGYGLLPHRAAASYERLTAIARAAKAAGDPRKMDELRVDAMLDLLAGEGVATGGPITNGGLDELPAVDEAACQPDTNTPWPTAPADPDLLHTAADPATTSQIDGAGSTQPLDPPDQPPAEIGGDPAIDPEHEQLRPYWLAGFDQLPTSRPATCRAPLPAPRRGVIDLQMSLTTLMGLDDLPAELSGFGPLLADIARQVVEQRPDLQLRFSVYNEIDSLLVHGTTRIRPMIRPPGRRTKRRPTAEVAALVRARNRTCAAPGCRVPSLRCELDHVLAWASNGESEPDNLDPSCPRHHRFKHAPGSDLVAFNPGSFGWQTPLGMQYMSKPDPPLYDDHRYVHPPTP